MVRGRVNVQQPFYVSAQHVVNLIITYIKWIQVDTASPRGIVYLHTRIIWSVDSRNIHVCRNTCYPRGTVCIGDVASFNGLCKYRTCRTHEHRRPPNCLHVTSATIDALIGPIRSSPVSWINEADFNILPDSQYVNSEISRCRQSIALVMTTRFLASTWPACQHGSRPTQKDPSDALIGNTVTLYAGIANGSRIRKMRCRFSNKSASVAIMQLHFVCTV